MGYYPLRKNRDKYVQYQPAQQQTMTDEEEESSNEDDDPKIIHL